MYPSVFIANALAAFALNLVGCRAVALSCLFVVVVLLLLGPLVLLWLLLPPLLWLLDTNPDRCCCCRCRCHSVQPPPLPPHVHLPAHPALPQAVFLLIGKTSALTMNIAGVIKDWMLIFFSYSVFKVWAQAYLSAASSAACAAAATVGGRGVESLAATPASPRPCPAAPAGARHRAQPVWLRLLLLRRGSVQLAEAAGVWRVGAARPAVGLQRVGTSRVLLQPKGGGEGGFGAAGFEGCALCLPGMGAAQIGRSCYVCKRHASSPRTPPRAAAAQKEGAAEGKGGQQRRQGRRGGGAAAAKRGLHRGGSRRQVGSQQGMRRASTCVRCCELPPTPPTCSTAGAPAAGRSGRIGRAPAAPLRCSDAAVCAAVYVQLFTTLLRFSAAAACCCRPQCLPFLVPPRPPSQHPPCWHACLTPPCWSVHLLLPRALIPFALPHLVLAPQQLSLRTNPKRSTTAPPIHPPPCFCLEAMYHRLLFSNTDHVFVTEQRNQSVSVMAHERAACRRGQWGRERRGDRAGTCRGANQEEEGSRGGGPLLRRRCCWQAQQASKAEHRLGAGCSGRCARDCYASGGAGRERSVNAGHSSSSHLLGRECCWKTRWHLLHCATCGSGRQGAASGRSAHGKMLQKARRSPALGSSAGACHTAPARF